MGSSMTSSILCRAAPNQRDAVATAEVGISGGALAFWLEIV